MYQEDEYRNIKCKIDKRTYHNYLERERRNQLKHSFTNLRDALPYFKGGTVRASREQILNKAAEHIEDVESITAAHCEAIDKLQEGIVLLEDEIDILQNAATTGDFETAIKILASPIDYDLNLPTPCPTTDNDTTDSDDLPSQTIKRRRVSHLPKKAKRRNVEYYTGFQ